MAGDEAAEIPNPYRAAIVSAKASCAPDRQTLRTGLRKAASAMESQAWVGGKADSFGADLTGWTADAKAAAEDAETEFDEAVADQPETVPPNAWQVHWHNLRP